MDRQRADADTGDDQAFHLFQLGGGRPDRGVQIELGPQHGDRPERVLQTVRIEGDRRLPVEILQRQILLPEKAMGRAAEEAEMFTEKLVIGEIGMLPVH